MPLSFETLSHGRVAFGFFNIESDMLLLQQYFFFADAFCRFISTCAEKSYWHPDERFAVYEIADPAAVGDLRGAINGTRHTGFIGQTYLRFPFPDKPEDFRQNPFGDKTQNLFKELIARFAECRELEFSRRPEDRVRFGEYLFDKNSFQALVRYVERGGMPRWKDNLRPQYVQNMRARIAKSDNPLFRGLEFDPGP